MCGSVILYYSRYIYWHSIDTTSTLIVSWIIKFQCKEIISYRVYIHMGLKLMYVDTFIILMICGLNVV